MTEPTFTIEGRLQRGVSASFRVVVHAAARVRSLDDRVREVTAADAHIFHCAVYARAVLKNGWEPFDQPSPCAYLPFGYGDLQRKQLPRFGALLVRLEPLRGEFHTFLVAGDSGRFAYVGVDAGRARTALRTICREIGVGSAQATTTVRVVEKRLAPFIAAA